MTVGDLMGRTPSLRLEGLGLSVWDRDVTAVDYDSRRVTAGSIFVALNGQYFDGAAFAGDAEAQGALLVVSASPPSVHVHIPWLVVEDARLTLAELAAAFNNDPSRNLTVVGVTGTNGKTSTMYLLTSIFTAAGRPCGQIGSVGYDTGGVQREADRTTPEAPEVQGLLREMVQHQRKACVMEVSSHALEMRRVDKTRFAAATFSNLTRDHLDYHMDMNHYFGAKRRLFEMLPDGAPAVINIDDPFGRQLVQVVGRPVTYAIDRPADVAPERVAVSLSGASIDLHSPRGRLHLRSQLAGKFNVYNVLAAASTAIALDVPFRAIEQGINELKRVPGRFEIVSSREDEMSVVIDYAHTDDALRAVLGAARELCSGRVISVFGCGGDRDSSKRPLMGAVAARLSDLVVLTSDNPRSEEPDGIIDEIRKGMDVFAASAAGPAPLSIPDRGAAIEYAIDAAESGDMVIIAGKGHESHQVVGNERRPFDDRLVAGAALARRRSRSHV